MVQPGGFGGAGKVRHHVSCLYHGDLGVADSADEANTIAAAHLRARHATKEKGVAENADVMIQEIRHFSAQDLKPSPAQD